jgi:hypothetical protein
MRALMNLICVLGVLAVGMGLAGCTNRPLSAMDTYWLTGNTHPHLVWKDEQVQYQQ